MSAVMLVLVGLAFIAFGLLQWIRGHWHGYDQGFEDGYNQRRHRRDKVVVRPRL